MWYIMLPNLTDSQQQELNRVRESRIKHQNEFMLNSNIICLDNPGCTAIMNNKLIKHLKQLYLPVQKLVQREILDLFRHAEDNYKLIVDLPYSTLIGLIKTNHKLVSDIDCILNNKWLIDCAVRDTLDHMKLQYSCEYNFIPSKSDLLDAIRALDAAISNMLPQDMSHNSYKANHYLNHSTRRNLMTYDNTIRLINELKRVPLIAVQNDPKNTKYFNYLLSWLDLTALAQILNVHVDKQNKIYKFIAINTLPTIVHIYAPDALPKNNLIN